MTRDDCAALMQSLPKSLPDRARKLLRAIERRTLSFGCLVVLKGRQDYPLAYSKTDDEFGAFLRYLISRKLIEPTASQEGGYAVRAEVSLTADGFAELEKANGIDSHQAFVAMWSDPSMNRIFLQTVDPAIRACGYDPLRVEFKQFNDDIVARIMADIRESRFVVAEFVGHRQNVYFEAGFALGLGLPVIFVCRDDEIENAEFDANHFNFVRWTTPEELAQKLRDRIIGTIGRGPLTHAP
jgi:hypothetical protein